MVVSIVSLYTAPSAPTNGVFGCSPNCCMEYWIDYWIDCWMLWMDAKSAVYESMSLWMNRFQKFWRSEAAPKPCGCLWPHHWHIFAASLGKQRTWVLLTTTRCHLPSLVICILIRFSCLLPSMLFECANCTRYPEIENKGLCKDETSTFSFSPNRLLHWSRTN